MSVYAFWIKFKILMHALQNFFFLRYTIDEYDYLLCFLAAESDSDIGFSPPGLDFATHEVTIFRNQ